MSGAPTDTEIDTRKGAEAFAVWCVLRAGETRDPELLKNPYFMAIREQVFFDMMAEFGRR
jgi:hypothetical protein